MAIHKIARFEVKPDTLGECLDALRIFLAATKSEPGTLLYESWQERDAPTRFIHLMTFADAAAEDAHRTSEAVKVFTALLYPNTVGGVQFIDCTQIDA